MRSSRIAFSLFRIRIFLIFFSSTINFPAFLLLLIFSIDLANAYGFFDSKVMVTHVLDFLSRLDFSESLFLLVLLVCSRFGFSRTFNCFLDGLLLRSRVSLHHWVRFVIGFQDSSIA